MIVISDHEIAHHFYDGDDDDGAVITRAADQ
jgi:hypothetical protein